MITGKFWKLHNDAELQKIDAAAVRLLSRSGCRVEHEGLLGMLEGAGCRISRIQRRCYIPEPLVRTVLERIGGQSSENVEIPVGWNPQHALTHGGNFPHILEWPSGRRRLATRQDVIDMARMAHTLDEFKTVGKVLSCSEVDQRIEPLWSVVQLAETTNKSVGGGEIFYPDYIEPLVRMGEVLTGIPGDTHLVAACDFFTSPLIFDSGQAECFLEKRRFGIKNVPGTMPISGISAPITIAGTAAVALAELMAGWVFGYAVNPDIPAGGIVATGSMDMRTTSTCFGSPEALLQDVTVVQICRRLYGIDIHAATSYVDCKRPGLEAVFQKMFPLVGAAFGTGLSAGGGGLLSAGQDYSPVQHLLDTEFQKGIARFFGAFDINEDTIAVDLIEEMMQKSTTNFLDTDHTLNHYRSEQWYPKWLDRTFWQGQTYEVDAEHRMLKRIDEYCRDAIRRYEKPDIDEGKLAELRGILNCTEHQILGKRRACA